MIYDYRGSIYPDYLKTGNASQHIAATAAHYCKGNGIDIGAGKWPLPGAVPFDLAKGQDAMELPDTTFDYVFSSHCLEHVRNPVAALEHWIRHIRPGGVLFVFLPHPDMTYWLPQNCRKHLHSWQPKDMAQIFRDLGLVNVLHSERDLAWSFSCVGFKPC